MKEELKQAIETIKANWPPENRTMIREALSIVINETSRPDNWISVEESQPKDCQHVLFCSKSGNIDKTIYWGRDMWKLNNGPKGREYYGKYGRYFEAANNGYIVTHWQPLPPPPEVIK